MKTYEALAQAFQQLGVTDCFALMGDANMHWAGAMAELGTNMVYTRHEHAAVAAAVAYTRSTGRAGCATVTCGPGLTQVMTILPIAVRAKLPLVIFAGEAPLNKPWYNQEIDQEPFVRACGARYVALHDPATMITQLADAFKMALSESVPVVLGVPFDVQKQEWTGDPVSLSQPTIYTEPVVPEMATLFSAASWLDQAERPSILAGLGALDAKEACIALAEKSGALLATTLPARGLFMGQEFLIGLSGGFAPEPAREIFAQADLVVGIGTSLAAHAFDGGKLMPEASVIHLDLNPQEQVQGRKAADMLIRADARLGTEALTKFIQAKSGWRSDEMRTACHSALQIPNETETPDGLLHPMGVAHTLGAFIPKDWHVINTSGHCSYFFAQMQDHPQDHFTVIREFGAIGNGTSYALGLATAYPTRKIALLDGDGSALMHIQELETMKRHNLNILVVIMNDGAYGSEVHKLRADGVSEAGSVFGRPDFAAIATGFGIAARRIEQLHEIPAAVAAFENHDGPMVLDLWTSDQIMSPQILRAHKAV